MYAPYVTFIIVHDNYIIIIETNVWNLSVVKYVAD